MPHTKSPKPVLVVAISEFKTKCLALLEQVSKTKTPLRVVKRGKPIADVIPAAPPADERSWLGSMSDTFDIVGDVVSPVIDLQDFEALKR